MLTMNSLIMNIVSKIDPFALALVNTWILRLSLILSQSEIYGSGNGKLRING